MTTNGTGDSYDYDPLNRLTETPGGDTLDYGADGQFAELDGNRRFQYDTRSGPGHRRQMARGASLLVGFSMSQTEHDHLTAGNLGVGGMIYAGGAGNAQTALEAVDDASRGLIVCLLICSNYVMEGLDTPDPSDDVSLLGLGIGIIYGIGNDINGDNLCY